MFSRVIRVAVLPMLTAVSGHAVVDRPQPRVGGATQEALCGAPLTQALKSDLAQPIETAIKNAGGDITCNPYLCRGYQWEDNMGSLQVLKSGEIVPFHVDLVAAHRPGYANVSVIDLSTNSVIGEPLKSWDAWPGTDTSADRDDINFNVTIPDDLAEVCNAGGLCAIQWFWYVIQGPQRYESCVDFMIES